MLDRQDAPPLRSSRPATCGRDLHSPPRTRFPSSRINLVNNGSIHIGAASATTACITLRLPSLLSSTKTGPSSTPARRVARRLTDE